MKITKLCAVLERQDFNKQAKQYLKEVVPDSVSISSVALNGLKIVIKGQAKVLMVRQKFEMVFEMSPAKKGDALFLKLKNANSILNGILKTVFPDVPGLDYSWRDEGITISFNRLLRPMGISVAKLESVEVVCGSVRLNFG